MPTTKRVGVVRVTVDIDPRVAEWVKQRAADEGVPFSVVVRRALDREMVANPLTGSAQVTEDLLAYLGERFHVRGQKEEAAEVVAEERTKDT